MVTNSSFFLVVTLLMSVSMARSITAKFGRATRGFGAIGARRSYSRSTLMMGFIHSYNYKPEGYPDLEERKKLFTRVSDEAALLYTNMPALELMQTEEALIGKGSSRHREKLQRRRKKDGSSG